MANNGSTISSSSAQQNYEKPKKKVLLSHPHPPYYNFWIMSGKLPAMLNHLHLPQTTWEQYDLYMSTPHILKEDLTMDSYNLHFIFKALYSIN